MKKPSKEIITLVRAALAEDIGRGDITSLACLEPHKARAVVVAKSDGVLSGLVPFLLSYQIVDAGNQVNPLISDGETFRSGDTVIEIDGFNQSLLTSERVALNFLGHLSGIATLTSKFVDEIKGTDCSVLDTRKTTPGWRLLEKMAVVHGGGRNHRMGLYDMILIKDNHIAAAGSIRKAVSMARGYLNSADFRTHFKSTSDQVDIEVEVTTDKQVREAMACGVKRLLLDNQSIESLTDLVKVARDLDDSVVLEASGNVTLKTVGDIARTGVDLISAGALTHSAPDSDFSMRIVDEY